MENIFYKINNSLIKNYILIFIFNFLSVLFFSNIGNIQNKVITNAQIFTSNHDFMLFVEMLSFSIINIILFVLSYIKYKSLKEEFAIYTKSVLDSNGIDTDHKDLDKIIEISIDKLNEKIIKYKNVLNEKEILIKNFNELNIELTKTKEILKENMVDFSIYIENLKNYNTEKYNSIKNIEIIINNINNYLYNLDLNFEMLNIQDLKNLIIDLNIKEKLLNNLKNVKILLNEVEIILISFMDIDKVFPEELIKNIQNKKKIIEHEINLINTLIEHQNNKIKYTNEKLFVSEQNFNKNIENFINNLKNEQIKILQEIKKIKLELEKLKALNVNIEKLENIFYNLNNINIQQFKKEIEKLLNKNKSIKIKEIYE